MSRIAMSTPQLLLARSEVTVGGCRIWTGSISRKGYGRLKVRGKTVSAHRTAYEVWVGPIPEGLEIDHLCRNRACIEPSHLEAVTHQVNIDRSIRRDRPSACPQGHPYDEANARWRTNGQGYPYRRCLACYNADRRRRRALKGGAA